MVITGTKRINTEKHMQEEDSQKDRLYCLLNLCTQRRIFPLKPLHRSWLNPLSSPLLVVVAVLLVLFFTINMAQAKRKVEQYNLPVPQSYANHELRVEVSNHRPEVGKPVILKAIISPQTRPEDIDYQFLINGAPIPEPGMHKVHTFKETGTYKISAVAKLGVSYLLNSPPIIVHVIDSWVEPEAVISPAIVNVKTGEEAIFTSESETDPESRQWLYWSMSTGHRGNSEQFVIPTKHLKPGKYPIELLVKDDRNRESRANAYLLINDDDNEHVETLTLDVSDDASNEAGNNNNLIQLRSSHTHRLENMLIVFWIQNAQPGADTELQLDSGDGNTTPWSKKLRYGYRYPHFGIYTSKISARSPNFNQHSNLVTVYVWPLWLPVIMVILGLLLAGIPFFRKQQQNQEPILDAQPIQYSRQADSGQHQLVLTSEKETPALTIHQHKDDGHQTLTEINKPKNTDD